MFKLKRRHRSRASRNSRGGGHPAADSVNNSVRSDGSSTIQSSSLVLRSCLKSTDRSVVSSKLSANTQLSNNSSDSDRRGSPRGVRFQHVRMKEYERIIGDNPSCSSGAPVGIGWKCSEELIVGLDEYETARAPRRRDVDLVLTRQDREEILIEWGANFNQIIEAIRSTIKAKNQRRRTVNSIGTYDRWEEAMENASRKLKRTLLLQKNTIPKYGQHTVSSNDAGRGPPKVPVRLSLDNSDEFRSRSLKMGLVSKEDELEENDRHDSEATSESKREEQLLSLESYEVPNNSNASLLPDPLLPLHEVHIGDHEELSEYTNYYSFGTHTSQNTNGSDNDGFEFLTRDQSFWEVRAGRGYPKIHRKMTAIIISEDGTFEDPVSNSEQYSGWQQGYGPPPFSDSMLSNWH